MQTLNITNGSSAVDIMKAGGISGDFLTWDDVIHEGPVPANLPLELLSQVRAQYIADRGWEAVESTRTRFKHRDDKLMSFRNYRTVVLWFEHDLYDQLQLLQILDWFYDRVLGTTDLFLICTDRYLGMQSPESMALMENEREGVTRLQLGLAQKAWAAFRSNSPLPWQDLLNEDTGPLPFLEGAVIRLLEEYPDHRNGLSRTANRTLEIINSGIHAPGQVFRAVTNSEERMFMGDLSFWNILDQMLESQSPLITLPVGMTLTHPPKQGQELRLTPTGQDVLTGKTNWLDLTESDRWIGGVCLNKNNRWSWNPNTKSIVKTG